MVVKEYKDGKTKIRIHNDFFRTEENTESQNTIISLLVKNIYNLEGRNIGRDIKKI